MFANQGKRVKQTSKSLRQVGALKNSKIFGWPNYDDQVFIRFPYPISLCVRNNINTDAIFIMRNCFKNQDASEFWLIQSEIQTKLNTNCLLLTLERSQRKNLIKPKDINVASSLFDSGRNSLSMGNQFIRWNVSTLSFLDISFTGK